MRQELQVEGMRGRWGEERKRERWEEEGGEMKIADLSPRRPPGTWRRRKVHRLSQIHKN